MTDEDPTLDDELVRALRDVPPVDPQLRERHISAALEQIGVSGHRSGSARSIGGRWAVAAAVAIGLVGAGFALGNAGSNTDTGVVAGPGTSVVGNPTPVKGNASASNDTVAENSGIRSLSSPCNETMELDPVARYRTDNGWRIAYVREVPSATLLIVDETTCTVVQEIDLP